MLNNLVCGQIKRWWLFEYANEEKTGDDKGSVAHAFCTFCKYTKNGDGSDDMVYIIPKVPDAQSHTKETNQCKKKNPSSGIY